MIFLAVRYRSVIALLLKLLVLGGVRQSARWVDPLRHAAVSFQTSSISGCACRYCFTALSTPCMSALPGPPSDARRTDLLDDAAQEGGVEFDAFFLS